MSFHLHTLVGRDLTRTYGERTVLDGIDLTVSPGQRLGLIGENGSGKSTLLRLLAGTEEPDAGSIESPEDVAYLPQEPHFAPGTSIGSVLDHALAPLHAAVRDVESLGRRLAEEPDLAEAPDVADTYAERLEWAEAHDAWDADRRARRAAARLGLHDLARDRDVARLSGGQRSRLALAALITRRPSAALLDEPTNHLDDDALTLLEEFLVDLPGIVVAASHDRVFLDRACTHVFDLDPPITGRTATADASSEVGTRPPRHEGEGTRLVGGDLRVRAGAARRPPAHGSLDRPPGGAEPSTT